MAGINSKWRKGAVRHSQKTTLDHTRQVRDKHGVYRSKTDSPTEKQYVERLTARSPGWVNGARVHKPDGAK